MSTPPPTVNVAMATFNGLPWIESQVRTVLDQEGVNVSLVVSDDGSTDGTRDWLEELGTGDPRVVVLPRRDEAPSVAGNFLYAITSLQMKPGEYAAFADQDDLWPRRKLIDQIEFMRRKGAHAVSANVTAFAVNERGQATGSLIRKDQAQVEWDFLFEAPGPGSTFVLDYCAWATLVRYLDRWDAEGVSVHDWFVYVILRASDVQWSIDQRSQVAYRQHERNVVGAHRGIRAFTNRLRLLRSGHYRQQFKIMVEVAQRAGELAGRTPEFFDGLEQWRQRLNDTSLHGRLDVARNARSMRRRPVDQLALATACVLGVW